MLTKIIVLASLLIATVGYIFYAGKNSEKVDQQKQIIGIQNEVIQKNQDVQKRKAIAKDTSVVSDLDWLRNN